MSPWRPFLILLLVAGALLRLHGIFFLKKGLSQDESVSYLCAAATQGRYERDIARMPDTLIVAGDIHRYYRPAAHLELARVAGDLAHFDIHPPLYFWCLHVAHTWFGFHLWTGPLINFVITLLMLALLFHMARGALGGTLAPLAACVIWYLSPAVVQIDLEGRHYQLFGLLGLASFHLSERLINGGPTRGRWAAFIAVNALGFLTHYYFGFLLIPGAVLMLRRAGLSRILALHVASLLLSFAVFVLVFPGFFDAIATYMKGRPLDDMAFGVPARMLATFSGTLMFFTWWEMAKYAGLAASIVFVGLRLRSPRTALRDLVNGGGNERMAVHQWTLLWCFVFTTALYVGRISPGQAVGEQYFSYVWPLLALVVVHWTRPLFTPRVERALLTVYSFQLLISCALSVRGSDYVATAFPSVWYERMNASDLVITNEHRRAWLPRTAIHLNADQPLYLTTRRAPSPFFISGISDITVLHAAKKQPLPEYLEAPMERLMARHGEAAYGEHELHEFTRR